MSQVETTVEGRVIAVGPDKKSEAIVFEVPLGLFKIVAIANIPNDEDTAPVYVRIELNNGLKEAMFQRRPPTQRPRMRRNGRSQA